MSYTHRNINKILSNSNNGAKVEEMKELAKQVGWELYYDEWPVSQEMFEYCTALKKAMPSIKLYPENVQNIRCGAEIAKIVCKYYVYMDGFPFALGHIGYGDYAVSTGSNVYMVESRKIQNNKFHPSRDQHYMAMSGDLNKAVRNACKYLVPHTSKEMMKINYEPFFDDIRQVSENLLIKARKTTEPVINDWRVIVKEVTALKAKGVEFTTDLFKQMASQVDTALEDYYQREKTNIGGLFVWVRKHGDNTYVEVQEVEKVNNKNAWAEPNITAGHVYPIDALPQDIAEKVAVLSILENERYVEGIGRKIDDTSYWIERVKNG